jgi:hypothetical protein
MKPLSYECGRTANLEPLVVICLGPLDMLLRCSEFSSWTISEHNLRAAARICIKGKIHFFFWNNRSYVQAIFAGRILLIVALTLSKVSVVALIRHLFTQDMRKAWAACNYYAVAVVFWGLMSIMALSVDCSSTSLLDTDQSDSCPNQVRLF